MTSVASLTRGLLLGIWGFFAGSLMAQEEGPRTMLRFLAVGNTPPFEGEWIDGVLHEVEAPPGSIPPRRLVVERRGAEDEENEEVGQVTLKLGRLSQAVELKSAKPGVLQLREKDASEPWAEVRIPGEGEFLVLLRRAGKGGKWNEVEVQVVRHEPTAGSLRFVNATARPLAIVLDEKRIALRSGKIWDTRLGPGKVAAFQLGWPDGNGGLDRVLSRSLEQGSGERTLVILSEADREDARMKLKVTELRSSVRKRLPPGADAG